MFTFVQTAQNNSGTPSVVTLGAAAGLNNLLVVNIKIATATTSITSVVDSAGNTYVQAAGPVISAAITTYQYYAVQTIAGATSVTITFTGGAINSRNTVDEYSGGIASNAFVFDKSASNTGTGTSSSVTLAPASAGELVAVGVSLNAATAITAGTNYTIATNNTSGSTEYDLSATTSETAPLSWTTSGAWIEIAGAYFPISRYKSAILSSNPMSYAKTVLSDSPFGYWTFGDNGGTVATDQKSNNGTYTAAPTLGVAGLLTGAPSSAVTFAQASSQYAALTTLGSFGSLLGSGFSMEFWIETTYTTALAQLGMLNSADSMALVIDFNRNASLIYTANVTDFYIRDKNGLVLNGTISKNIYDGNPHHVVWSCGNPGSNAFTVYVDGVSQTITYGTQATPAAFSNFAYTFCVGGSNVRGTPGNFMSATFEEFALYSYGLSATQVTNHYTAGTTQCLAPVSYYRMDDVTTTMVDTMGIKNGTYSGGYTQSQGGLISDPDASVLFNGTTGAANANYNPLTGSASTSYECWVNITASLASGVLGIIMREAYYGGFHGLALNLLGQTSGNPKWSLAIGTGTAMQTYSVGTAISLNTTYYVVLTVSGTSVILYVNGVVITTQTLPATYAPIEQSDSQSFSLMQVGATAFVQGSIDEAAVYNYALSQAQVTAHYAAGLAVIGAVGGSTLLTMGVG
jgi:hypothetical protein